MRRPRTGERFIVRKPFETVVTTQWFAPFTGGSRKVVPAGISFVVDYEPPPQATAVSVKPDEPDRWLDTLVDETDRCDPKFGGYHISIPFDVLASHCEPID